jgi:hypothetical protein
VLKLSGGMPDGWGGCIARPSEPNEIYPLPDDSTPYVCLLKQRERLFDSLAEVVEPAFLETDQSRRSSFKESIKRRDGAMRRMLGMGAHPVGRAEDEPQVRIWRIAGNRERAGWTDTVETGA